VPWGKVIYEIAIRGDAVLPVESLFYRRANDTRPERTLAFSDVRELGGRLVPAVVTVTVPEKPGEHTRLRYEKLAFDMKIPKHKFSEQALRK
jgi:hypothetical protein